MNERTAEILVKANKMDSEFQRILVRDGEFYHPQLFKWLALPTAWKEKAERALNDFEDSRQPA